MGTAERRLEIMKYLCKARFATMSDLAKKFDVSVRKIKRDIDELGNTIPLEIKTGRYEGGVYVMSGYSWDKAYMSLEDIALLTEIKNIGEKQQPLALNSRQLKRLEEIIRTYSVPRKNGF